MSDCPFKVGDKVTICNYGDPVGMSRVERITKSPKAVHLSDGSKWKLSGYGRHGDRFSWSSIRITDPEHDAQVRRNGQFNNVVGADRSDWSKLTDDELATVADILAAAKARKSDG